MYIADQVRAERGSMHPLVGLLGLSFADSGELHYQFAVNAHIPDSEHYLIQLYEWIIGEPSNQQLVSLQWFIDHHVKFYTNEADWKAASEEAMAPASHLEGWSAEIRRQRKEG